VFFPAEFNMHSISLKIRKRTGGGAASVMGFSFRALLFLEYADLCFFFLE